MRLLVTNDDGIESEGIQVLARHLAAAGHEVLIVAPDGDYSGSGAALGDLVPDVGLAVRRVELEGLESVEAWALAGPPALTVLAGRLGAFGEPPEFVVSGINAGLNTGRSILHSGTVGAALTAQNFGLSGLAVSLERTDGWHWDTAAAIATEVLGQVARGPARSVVNLNVPGLPRDQVEGVRWARLAPFGAVRTSITGQTAEHVQFELVATDYRPEPDTDQGTVEAGWASLTTLVGVVEAWPPDTEQLPVDQDFSTHIAPGAALHPIHEVPDADEHHW
ncbi:MAG TPA: 5'/3'-nucleotidase SurE, partial [Acidimicrobiales bacterium]